MNGGVNGTMEEPVELSLPASPNTKKHAIEENKQESHHCEKNNSVEIHNHIENSVEPEIEDTSGCESKDDIQSNDKLCDQKIPNNDMEEAPQENSNIIPTENHCSNTTESSPLKLSSLSSRLNTKVEDMEIKKDDSVNAEDAAVVNERTDKMEVLNDLELEKNEQLLEKESSISPVEQKAEDTVSLNTEIHNDKCDDVQSKTCEKNGTQCEIASIENEHKENGRILKSTPSHAVEEMVTGNDCALENNTKAPVTENRMQLRRSSRAIKRKRYDVDMENGDDATDDAIPEDTLRRKTRPIVINDTRTLVQMAVKQMRGVHVGNQKKEPTVVIIDTNSAPQCKPVPIKNSNNTNLLGAHNYLNYVGRGTSITPVKSNSSTQSSQPLILPSLTDDMFVVEAPSFIVPYVYEKPSVKPFREFVDLLGSELEQQKCKEEKELKDKEREEEDKEKKEPDMLEQAEEEEVEKGVKNEQSIEEKEDDDKKKNKEEKKAERRRRRNDDDDASWDGESSTESDDELGSDEEVKTIVIKEKVDSSEELKDVTRLTVDKVVSGKSDNYFDCSLGKFFMNIGLNLVQEFVQNDLLKQQNRKLHREKKAGHSTRATETSIASLMKNLEFSKENNLPYRHKQNKCELCSFKSESLLIMSHHLETPHMKNNLYKCNYCTFEIRSPHDILYHMEAEHNVRGKLERAPAYHQCANCPFEDNGKGKLARHLIPCAKKFKPESNLAPPIEWEPPAKIPKITRSRNSMMSPYQSSFNRGTMNNTIRASTSGGAAAVPGGGGCVAIGGAFRMRGRNPVLTAPRGSPLHGAQVIRGGAVIRHSTPSLLPTNYATNSNGKNVGNIKSSMHQPSISITPLPRHPQPVQPQPAHQSKGTFVICEICDGYIKDLEQLRNHMQWIHKVKIHPKMIYNRPPLNCQKCQCRFFTDQGLERHLLGSHGLVTSSMQEAANKGKDGGRCPVCGRVYQWKLLNHVARDHNLTLKPAHLSYKCTVCTATFGMYKQFESHVYSAHSVVAKRVMDKSKIMPNKPNDSLLKPLKINDEITIIPQPAKTATQSKDK